MFLGSLNHCDVRVGKLERDVGVGKNSKGAVGSPRAVVAFGL
jgi:hypothetical protein